MVISNLHPQAPRPPQLQERVTEGKAIGQAEDQTPLASTNVDSVRFQGRVSSLESQRIIVERILSRTEVETSATLPSPAAQELFAVAGKADFEAAAAQTANNITPEATAGRIVDGITGYIFGAFQLSHPDMTEEDFLQFQEQVMRGFETGLEDAKDILTGLQAMDETLSASIDQTESLVREQLDTFFEEMLESLREEAGEAEEDEA